MKVNQSLLVKASILLVLTLSFIHAQYGIPFGGFGGMNPMGAQGGFGGAPYGSFGGLNPTGMGGLGGMGGNPFSFDQPYSSFPNYGGNNFGQNPYSSGGYPGAGNFGGSSPQNQYYPNQQGFGQQPNNNQNNMRLRFGGQIYGYNPFYYVANLIAVDLEYIQHFAQALTNTGFSGSNPFYNPISGMNLMGNQQQQQQQKQQPSTTDGAAATSSAASTTGTSSQDSLKASQEALAVVFAKEAQIHITHLVKQQDSYGPKGVGTLTTQLVDSSDKLVTAANNKKWNDYQQEYNNLNNGLSKLSYYGMQQNMPSYPNFGPQQQGQQQQGQQQQGGDSSGNVKGSSFYPFLSNQGAFTMPQAPQAPQVPEMPQQFANLQQNLPKQFSFPDMPQMPQIPQVPQMQQLGQQQGAQQQQQTRSF